MRTTKWTRQFKRDYRGTKGTRHGRFIDEMLAEVLKYLERDEPLPAPYNDHPLVGRWSGFRDCHLEFDLLLIYQKRGPGELVLVRLGSHSEIFG